MRKMDAARIIVFLFLAIAMIASPSLGLGIGPSRQYLSFSAGEVVQGEIIVINDAKEEFKAAVYAEGELSNYIKFEQELIDVSETDAMKAIPYQINFPNNAPSAGSHLINIVVRPLSKDTSSHSPQIKANMALISQMVIKVPYPGKYAEGKLFITGGESDGPVRFSVMTYNFGTENIDEAHIRVEILGPDLGKITEFNSATKLIASKQEEKLEASWEPSVGKGTYKAIITLYYDDKELKLEQQFDIGTQAIEVSDISVSKFTLGDVAKFDIQLFNSWNTEINDVYAEVLIEDQSGKRMTEFKTPVIKIMSQEIGKLEAYWYTEGVSPGIYTVKVVIHYLGKATQKKYDFEVSTNSIKQIGGVTGRASGIGEEDSKGEQKLIIWLILIVLILLIGMNVVWFYFLSKKIKGGQK